MNAKLVSRVQKAHIERFGMQAEVVSYAPGRIEILGNHTDYNEGFVLSTAIDLGIAMVINACPESTYTLHALDIDEEVCVECPINGPLEKPVWANLILGVLAGLSQRVPDKFRNGFKATFAGNIPIAAGLSSSAALEVAAGLGFCAVAGVGMQPLKMAKLCQEAEHNFVGTQCGLLDQVSILFGKEDSLVFSDFRSLNIETAPVSSDIGFLIADTGIKHNLVESEYNNRRESCERAAEFFASVLDHPVKTLRDVSSREWKLFSKSMENVSAKRAAHVIEENQRVLEGKRLLAQADITGFGKLMFQSHESSRVNFQNSCEELDVIVSQAINISSVLGARLSGGGFGGSVVLMLRRDDDATVKGIISKNYRKMFGKPCDIRMIKPSGGARIITLPIRN